MDSNIFYVCDQCGDPDFITDDSIYRSGLCGPCYLAFSDDPVHRHWNAEVLAYVKDMLRFAEYRATLTDG